MSQIPETDSLLCKSCKCEIEESDTFCPKCGYPIKGSKEEQGEFIGQKILKKGKKDDGAKKIKSAKTTLFVISALTLVYGVIMFFTLSDLATLISNGIISGIYLGLAFWSSKKPFASLLTALLIYLSLQILNAFIDPHTIYQGIIWKILIISYLAKGLYSAWEIKSELQ